MITLEEVVKLAKARKVDELLAAGFFVVTYHRSSIDVQGLSEDVDIDVDLRGISRHGWFTSNSYVCDVIVDGVRIILSWYCDVVDRYHPLHDRGPVHSNKSLKDIKKEAVALAGRQEMARTAEAEGSERT